MYKSKVQVPRGAGSKNILSQLRRLFRGAGLQLPHHDVELWSACGERLEASVFMQTPVQLQCGCPALPETLRKLSIGLER